MRSTRGRLFQAGMTMLCAGALHGALASAEAADARVQGPPAPRSAAFTGPGRIVAGIGAGALAGAAAGAGVGLLAGGDAGIVPAAALVGAVWTAPASVSGALVGYRAPAWAGALAGAAAEEVLYRAVFHPGYEDTWIEPFLVLGGALSGSVAAVVAHEPRGSSRRSLGVAVAPTRRGVAGALRVSF